MNAISPYSLADIRKPVKALGGALREAGNLAAKHAAKSAGPDGSSARTGKLSGVSLAQVAKGDFALIAKGIAARATTGEGIGKGAKAAIGQVADFRADLKAATSSDPFLQAASEVVRGTLTDAARAAADNTLTRAAFVAFAAERAMQAHHRLASAPPALPGDPAARAPENLPATDLVRATYTTLIRLT